MFIDFTDPADFRLTKREIEVLRLVSLGYSAKESATVLDIAPSTVERHVENVRLKTRSRNRAHLIAQLVAAQLI